MDVLLEARPFMFNYNTRNDIVTFAKNPIR